MGDKENKICYYFFIFFLNATFDASLLQVFDMALDAPLVERDRCLLCDGKLLSPSPPGAFLCI
jgi:hypothetical protein